MQQMQICLGAMVNRLLLIYFSAVCMALFLFISAKCHNLCGRTQFIVQHFLDSRHMHALPICIYICASYLSANALMLVMIVI